MTENKATDTLCGKIIKSTGGLYTVEQKAPHSDDDGKIYECRAKGTFKKDKLTPLTGDNVTFLPIDSTTGFIVEISERKNSLVRPAVSNIDLLIMVVAVAKPDPDLFILDQLTAIASFNGIELLIIINKADLKNAHELADIYRKSGIDTVVLSAHDSDSFAHELAYIKDKAFGKTTFFSGASGVGKTSLLNALYPTLNRETGEISRKISRGKHTTRLTELFKVGENTYIGDTPGFSMVDVVGFNLITFDGLLGAFPDIEKYALGCKYTDCTHVCEDGCMVIKAIDDGNIQKTRHESFVALYKQLKNVKPWSKNN